MRPCGRQEAVREGSTGSERDAGPHGVPAGVGRVEEADRVRRPRGPRHGEGQRAREAYVFSNSELERIFF